MISLNLGVIWEMSDKTFLSDLPRHYQDDKAVNRWTRELELSIVVPTFNEVSNVHELIRRIDGALAGISWELIIVDDCPAGNMRCVV